MRTGLFGGSFDPIHAGHVAPVREAKRRLALDRVLYLPTASPPHKPGAVRTAPHHRYTMVELALLDEAGLFVSPHEMAPGRPSYTVDTVEFFRRELANDELHLLLGADSFLQLPEWRRWRELVESVRLVVLTRPGFDPAGADPVLRERLAEGAAVLVENPPVPWSATTLRRLLARGEAPPAGSMARPVLQYIDKYALYREPGIDSATVR